MDKITRIMNGYTNAQEAAEYEEALVLDEEVIEGTDYRLIISTEYDGEYPPVNN